MTMKLIDALEILRRSPSEDSGQFVVSLVCSFTPLHLQTFLTAQLQLLHRDHRIKVQTGLYGDLLGNLARVRESKADAAIVIIEMQDLDPRLGIRSLGGWVPELLPKILDNVKARSTAIANAIERLSREMPLAVCFPTLPLPPISYTPGWQAGAFETELRACVSKLASQVVQLSNVRLLNPQRLDLLSPQAERFDVKSEVLTGFPYRMSHAASLAELLAHLVLNPAPKKGLITDLDDTVWKGILGEVGPDGVSWDLDHHSHMHAVYQQFVHALSKAGVLVGVASKNDPNLVDEIFNNRSPILPKDAIFPIEAGWGPKSQSIGRILKAWNVGSESIVFVDDSPIELAEVKATYPAVECFLFPKDDPQAVLELLKRLRDIFGKSLLQEEDTIRLDSLRRADLTHQTGELLSVTEENFLEQAEAELTFSFNRETLDPRALELVNKTNQFNLNGKRHTQASLQNYVRDSDAFLLVASYKDKYGPLGKIAVVAGRYAGKKLLIDSWVMSCRAFSRQIEHRCFEELVAKFDAEEIEFDFVATPRNEPLRIFLAELLGTNPVSPCRLSKRDFLKRQPKTYHRVLELTNG
jgi:FkbH-like protein